MALSEISNGIGEKYEGNGFTFEPGWYRLVPLHKGDDKVDIRIESREVKDKDSGEFVNKFKLVVPFEAIAKGDGSECGKFLVFKEYWDLQAEYKDYVAFLKFSGVLEALIANFGDNPDYSNPAVEQWFQLILPMHAIKADVYIQKGGKEYTNKDGELKVTTDRKAFSSIEPVGDNAGGVADDDIPF